MQKDMLQVLVVTAVEAGKKILDIYEKGFDISIKEDQSPLTEADTASHNIIAETLISKFSDIPLLSEEGKNISYDERRQWEQYFLVDPLDGTKEFIRRNGEFTVNIALVVKNKPVTGVVYVPVQDILYIGDRQIGAFKIENASEKDIETMLTENYRIEIEHRKKDQPIRVVASRSHLSKETEDYIKQIEQKYGKTEIVPVGSSLKLCYIAENKADIYPRLGPTMEWDIAAGQAVVQAAGGTVVAYEGGQELLYNKKELVNPWFIVRCKDL